MTTKIKRALYKGSAIASLDGKLATLMVYYLGKLNYELTCTGRPHHLYTAPASIDDGMLIREFADIYKLTKIKLEFIQPTNPR